MCTRVSIYQKVHLKPRSVSVEIREAFSGGRCNCRAVGPLPFQTTGPGATANESAGGQTSGELLNVPVSVRLANPHQPRGQSNRTYWYSPPEPYLSLVKV